MRRRSVAVASGILMMILLAVPVRATLAAAAQLTLGEHSFDWTTVEEERAHFRWSADVVNETARGVEVEVTVDLLDDNDAVVHSDSTTSTLDAGQRRTVRSEGSLPFDRAADVVTFRFRIAPRPPDRH